MPKIVVTVDCLDPDLLATFWSAALGYEPQPGEGQYRPIVSTTDRPGPKILFQQVPDPTPGKNRWHLDIELEAGASLDDEVRRLVELGATVTTDEPVREFGIAWHILRDPEGNVFCVVAQD